MLHVPLCVVHIRTLLNKFPVVCDSQLLPLHVHTKLAQGTACAYLLNQLICCFAAGTAMVAITHLASALLIWIAEARTLLVTRQETCPPVQIYHHQAIMQGTHCAAPQDLII